MSPLIQNKKIHLNFEVLERLEGGLELLGLEVKSLRQGDGSLEGAYVVARGGEAFLVGAYIPPFQRANTKKDYDPYRSRKILITKKEILGLIGKEKGPGLTIVPVSVYNKGRKLKVEIAVVRGKKKFDKRQDMKEREDKRDMERTLKNQ